MAGKNYETVLIEKEDGITWLIMNRPEKRNAMSPQLHIEMDDALADLAVDPETQVLVLTGAGEAFCAGQDIRLYFRANDDAPAARAKARHASNQWRWQRLSTFPQPTIAMVNGYCFGGGFTQVCACDLAVAADEALFGLSEVNWGILPGGIVSWNVAQTLNLRDGMYYALTGDTFDGKKAKEIGFVNFSFPKEKLREGTVKLARKLMEKSPAVLRYTKEALRAVRFMNEPQAADYLNAKSDALRFADKEDSRTQGMKQFLDDKSYRPGFGAFKREKARRASS
ncbi:MAG TPA: p-hydroxycinnamoyl CoA hydratase/lyase [Xanthobacteraceae bacterium]|jgi:trans-feruloyl-CoA hydratase/vanillin synthase